MVCSGCGRSLQFCGPAYWNDLLPNVSSLKSGTTSGPLSLISVMLPEHSLAAEWKHTEESLQITFYSFVGSEKQFIFDTCLNGKPVDGFHYRCYVIEISGTC